MDSYFKWDMSRDIVNIYGPLSLRWYSLLFISGILVANYIFLRFVKREGRNVQACESLLYYVVVGTVVGARLGHCLFYDPIGYLSDPLSIFKIWEGGLASHGGYIGVLVSVYMFCRKFPEFTFLYVADRVSIVAVMAGAFIRMGNFFNSEIVGRVTDVPWAIIFAKVDPYPRHPTQLYEAAGYLIISFILYLFYRITKIGDYRGRLLGLACVLAFSFRACIEYFKENQVTFENSLPFNMGQLLSVPFILIGLFLLLGIQSPKSTTKHSPHKNSFV